MKERYGLALGLALVEVFVRAHLTPAWGTDLRLIPFSPAVLLAAGLGGMGPGLLATVVCAFGASWWLLPAASLGVAHPLDRVALMLFVAAGALLSGVIGKLHRTGRRERDARVAADAANRAKDESLAILGHEIRNPLAAITTAIHVLDHSGTPAQDAARLRGVIIREAEHLARMGDDLLDLGRMTAGKMVLERRPIDLADAIRGCLDTLGAAGLTGNHVIDLEAEPVLVAADPVRLEQVVVNLLVNALKYTAAGGAIRLTVKREHGGAVLRVQDSGAGIAPDVLPHVFEMFAQEGRTAAHARGGLGIGLSLVRRLVELHGGTVQASSEGPGRGSTFMVWLPALPVAPAEERRARHAATTGRPRRVVVVEDDPDGREALRLLLTQWGNEVHEAEDGIIGVEVSLRVRAEVVLIDLGLPRLDGYEVAKRIRKAPEGNGILLVALTGYGRSEDLERATAAGFDLHLVKPVDLGSLSAVFGRAPETPRAWPAVNVASVRVSASQGQHPCRPVGSSSGRSAAT